MPPFLPPATHLPRPGLSGETTRTLRYLRRQITPTSKFSPHVWFTQKRHLLAKAAILLERSRPLASPYRPPTCPGLARRRPFETKLSHSPVNVRVWFTVCMFGAPGDP